MAGTDSDRDGVHGSADKCPTKPAGKYDSNKNGCPGPYAVIKPRFRYERLTSSRGNVTIDGMTITGLPPGAVIVFTGQIQGTLRVGASRSIKISERGGDDTFSLGGGDRFGIRITRAGFIGYDALVDVSTTRGPVTIRLRCIPATGAQAPVSCSRVNRGK